MIYNSTSLYFSSKHSLFILYIHFLFFPASIVQFLTLFYLKQREHFKSDWHQLNIKRHVRSLPALSESEVKGILSGGNAVEESSSQTNDSQSHSADEDSDNDNNNNGGGGGSHSNSNTDSNTDEESEDENLKAMEDSENEENEATVITANGSGPRIYFTSSSFPSEVFSLYRAILCPKQPQLTPRQLNEMSSEQILENIIALRTVPSKTCVLMCR